MESVANMANSSFHVEAAAVTVETSLLAKLLEAVVQQQHELQALR